MSESLPGKLPLPPVVEDVQETLRELDRRRDLDVNRLASDAKWGWWSDIESGASPLQAITDQLDMVAPTYADFFITETPEGFPPEDIRKEWVGLVVPVRCETSETVDVYAREAYEVLRNQRPKAFEWFREYYIEDGRRCERALSAGQRVTRKLATAPLYNNVLMKKHFPDIAALPPELEDHYYLVREYEGEARLSQGHKAFPECMVNFRWLGFKPDEGFLRMSDDAVVTSRFIGGQALAAI